MADRVAGYMDQGYRHVRVQVSVPGLATYGAGARSRATVDDNRREQVWEPRPYVGSVPKLFEHLRAKFEDRVELLHDMHERVPPILAMQLVKDLEPYRPFFVEDPFSPEDIGYFGISANKRARRLRWENCSTARTSGPAWSASG